MARIADGFRIGSKQEIRARALEARQHLAEKDPLSDLIRRRFLALPEFEAARSLFVYVHVRDEVRTAPIIDRLLASQKQLVVPYCIGEVLRLFQLRSLADLAPGHFGILEPTESLRADPGRRVDPAQLDLLAVPGVAFDRHGGRLGHGRGYFDRLLQQLRPDAVTAGLAFECQLFEQVPMLTHDVSLDMIITETAVHRA